MSRHWLARARAYFSGLFFHPDNERFGTPEMRGLAFEDVTFDSNGNRLHGYLMRAVGRRKGSILHCHGNAGNVTSQFPLAAFLSEAGYDVLTFDYAGFGQSEGRPSLPGIENDARNALAYLLSRPDLDHERVAVFGQSLGGAAAAAAAAHSAVRCLVLEATFTTFRSMARATFIGRLLLPFVPILIPDGGPAAHLARFAPRPVLLVHGLADSVVPARFSKRLHRMFPSNTHLFLLPKIDHLTTAADEQPVFAEEIRQFLARHLA